MSTAAQDRAAGEDLETQGGWLLVFVGLALKVLLSGYVWGGAMAGAVVMVLVLMHIAKAATVQRRKSFRAHPAFQETPMTQPFGGVPKTTIILRYRKPRMPFNP